MGTELKMFSSFSTLANCEKTSYTQYFWQKILGYSQMKAQTTLIQKILHLFLRKLPKEYCKCQKRNRKLRSVHVHLVRNELSSAHIHFSLLKSDQHSVHERELNVNWTEKFSFYNALLTSPLVPGYESAQEKIEAVVVKSMSWAELWNLRAKR